MDQKIQIPVKQYLRENSSKPQPNTKIIVPSVQNSLQTITDNLIKIYEKLGNIEERQNKEGKNSTLKEQTLNERLFLLEKKIDSISSDTKNLEEQIKEQNKILDKKAGEGGEKISLLACEISTLSEKISLQDKKIEIIDNNLKELLENEDLPKELVNISERIEDIHLETKNLNENLKHQSKNIDLLSKKVNHDSDLQMQALSEFDYRLSNIEVNLRESSAKSSVENLEEQVKSMSKESAYFMDDCRNYYSGFKKEMKILQKEMSKLTVEMREGTIAECVKQLQLDIQEIEGDEDFFKEIQEKMDMINNIQMKMDKFTDVLGMILKGNKIAREEHIKENADIKTSYEKICEEIERLFVKLNEELRENELFVSEKLEEFTKNIDKGNSSCEVLQNFPDMLVERQKEIICKFSDGFGSILKSNYEIKETQNKNEQEFIIILKELTQYFSGIETEIKNISNYLEHKIDKSCEDLKEKIQSYSEEKDELKKLVCRSDEYISSLQSEIEIYRSKLLGFPNCKISPATKSKEGVQYLGKNH